MSNKYPNADFVVEELTDQLQSITPFGFEEGAGGACCGSGGGGGGACLQCSMSCYEPPTGCSSCIGCPSHNPAVCPTSIGVTPLFTTH